MLSHHRRIGAQSCLLGLLNLCLLLLSGCDPPPAPSGEKTAVLPQSGGQLTIMVAWPHVGATEKLAQLFYKETGAVTHIIKVEYYDLFADTLKGYKSPQPQADIYQVWYVNLGRLVEEGAIAQLDDFYAKHRQTLDLPDLIPHLFDNYTLYRGKRWTVPFDKKLERCVSESQSLSIIPACNTM